MGEKIVCIYCLKDSSGTRNLEHVISEASCNSENRSFATLLETNLGIFVELRLLSLDIFRLLTGWRNEIELETINNGYIINLNHLSF